MKQVVLVTGASGMVGEALIDSLLEENMTVRACIRSSSNSSRFGNKLNNLEIYTADMDDAFPASVMNGVTHVVHLAAKVHVHHRHQQAWEQFYRTNVLGTKHICEAALRAGQVKKIVFISTVSVYGARPAFDEKGLLMENPDSLYGRSKIMAEHILRQKLTNQIPYIILRPVMLYGPGDRGNMKRMVEAISKNRFVIPGTGLAKKNALYVGDFARIIRALLYKENNINDTFVVSNLNTLTLREMCSVISRLMGGSHNVHHIPLGPLKILARLGDYIPKCPLNSATLNKLTDGFDFAPYSRIQGLLGINEETSFEHGMSACLGKMISED